RLSSAITALLRARLAEARPGTLVTTQADAPLGASTRLAVTITRLDLTRAGSGALDATWQTIPQDRHAPVVTSRAAITLSGPTATDAETVALTRHLVETLAARIAATM
ncbi:membrane integrity-associated transporter subunit PqiC, partial [Endobacter medicaginis]